MAGLRTTADLVDQALRFAGETTAGTSDFEAAALDYINLSHRGVIAGGNEFGIDVDEAWVWAKSRNPIILELQPKQSGSVTLTQGSRTGLFSSAPSESLQGWYLQIEGREDFFVIGQHFASSPSFSLDQGYTGESGTVNYNAFKLEYELTDDTIIIDSTNNKIDFSEDGATEITATLDSDVYTPTTFAAEVKAQLDSAGSDTYTVSWDEISRKFTISSDGSTFSLFFGTGSNVDRSASFELGFDDKQYEDLTTYVSDNVLNAIQRLIAPARHYRTDSTFYTSAQDSGKCFGLDERQMDEYYPLTQLNEGSPDRFSVVRWNDNGTMRIRFNRYPSERMRIEFEYIGIPRDLHDNAGSIPIIPRAFREYLVFAATHYILLDKADNRAGRYEALAVAKLKALLNDNRKQMSLSGKNYARLIPRRDTVRIYREVR